MTATVFCQHSAVLLPTPCLPAHIGNMASAKKTSPRITDRKTPSRAVRTSRPLSSENRKVEIGVKAGLGAAPANAARNPVGANKRLLTEMDSPSRGL